MTGYKGLSFVLFAVPVLCTAQEGATTDAGQAVWKTAGTILEESGAEKRRCTGFYRTVYRQLPLYAHFSTCPQSVVMLYK